MKTTYFLTHESMNCPICGKLLRESRAYNEVVCSDPQCRFNDLFFKDYVPGGRGKMTIIDKAIVLLKDGAKRVDFEWDGKIVTAYWVGSILRIDVKGC